MREKFQSEKLTLIIGLFGSSSRYQRGLFVWGKVITPAKNRRIVEIISDRLIKQIDGLDTVGRIL